MFAAFIRLAQALLVLLCLSSTSSATVIVNYFHGTVRCETCLMIEQFAENILQQEFADEMKTGLLILQPININFTENKHFIDEYALTANELVVCIKQDQSAFIKVSDTWQLVNDYQKFKSTLSRFVVQALERDSKNRN